MRQNGGRLSSFGPEIPWAVLCDRGGGGKIDPLVSLSGLFYGTFVLE